MESSSFYTPVLLIIFNRPDTTRQVFEVIRQIKPKFLFVAADGPRPGREDDIEKCKAARKIINVDWECELITLYRNENLGCGKGPVDAISWFFKNIDQGIILEDDVLPHHSFFPFCQELLLRFKDDKRVAMIGGLNFLNRWKSKKASYFYSTTGATPGWACWRRVWENFDYDINNWNTVECKKKIKSLVKDKNVFKYYSGIFSELSITPKDDVWDYQWLFTRMNYGSSIIPSVNLISNIGFGEDATHTIVPDHLHSKMILNEIKFPLVHKEVTIDRLFDWYVFERYLNPQKKTIFKKAFLLLFKLALIEK